jgi:hypothetical protein
MTSMFPASCRLRCASMRTSSRAAVTAVRTHRTEGVDQLGCHARSILAPRSGALALVVSGRAREFVPHRMTETLRASPRPRMPIRSMRTKTGSCRRDHRVQPEDNSVTCGSGLGSKPGHRRRVDRRDRSAEADLHARNAWINATQSDDRAGDQGYRRQDRERRPGAERSRSRRLATRLAVT